MVLVNQLRAAVAPAELPASVGIPQELASENHEAPSGRKPFGLQSPVTRAPAQLFNELHSNFADR